ncbi:FAD-dependent oxidoreductase, partial [Roseovarius sp.]|uniref:FAD-dependent oxidoreductase n=1 Tax=Roseovarius sp. TaxID=1486281 RepID=UPI0035699BD3
EYLFCAPERICVDNALEAEAHGAVLRLRTRAELRDRDGDGFWRVGLEDAEGRCELVRARVVLNMAGTWADDVGRFGKRLIRGTKGAHIVIRLPEGYADRGIASLHRGGHPFYGLPLGKDRFYFGPTETLFEGDARDVRVELEDIDFLLGEANHLLPGLGLGRRDVEQCWAGIRPLTEDPAQPMGARERRIHDLGDTGFQNVLAMTAGPIMSHRSAGRRLLQDVRKRIGAPVLGRRPDPELADQGHNLRAADVIVREHAHDLFGVLVQRTGQVWEGWVSREDATDTARKVAPALGWSEARTAREIDAFMARQAREFHVPWHVENGPDHPGPLTGKVP